MLEGHIVHRVADEQRELIGDRLGVASLQVRFTEEAATFDGRVLEDIGAKGKHLFHHFNEDVRLHGRKSYACSSCEPQSAP